MMRINKQQGMATIVVTVVLLVVMTLMVIFAAKVGIFDQRMSANETRYKEAFAIADGGLDYSTQRFASEFKRLYDGTSSTTATTTLATIVTNATIASNTASDGTSPGANEAYFTVDVSNAGASFGGIPVYEFIATGIGSDGTGTATVQRQVTMANVFGGTVPNVPVIVGGAVGAGGNFNIVGNPNAAGEAVPVSVWASGDIEGTNSAATCHMEFYDGNNAQCSNPSGNDENISRGPFNISSHDASYPDLLPNDPNFPSDLFQFMFGVPQSEWPSKQAEAAAYGQAVTSCADLITAGTAAGDEYPLWWVSGDCQINGGTLGAISSPIILVIDDGELDVAGNAVINGIVYLFDNPDNVATPSADLHGTTEIVGSFVSDVGGADMSGSYSVVYNPNLIDSFTANGSNYAFAYIPASWRDF
jgi:type IV pilus assembly PilX-like protein